MTVHQPERVIVGYCPHCGRVVVVLNNHEVWPYIDCACGKAFSTNEIAERLRFERRPSRTVTDAARSVMNEPEREQDQAGALYNEAPEEVQKMLLYATTDPDTYYVRPWPPQDSTSPLFRNTGPQSGWSIGTERWLITAWRNEVGKWICGGSDDEGNHWSTIHMEEALAWLQTDPNGVPTR